MHTTGQPLHVQYTSHEDGAYAYIRSFKGNALNCVVEPVNGRGGIYIGNVEAATNQELLDSLKIRAVLSIDDQFSHSYFNCRVC